MRDPLINRCSVCACGSRCQQWALSSALKPNGVHQLTAYAESFNLNLSQWMLGFSYASFLCPNFVKSCGCMSIDRSMLSDGWETLTATVATSHSIDVSVIFDLASDAPLLFHWNMDQVAFRPSQSQVSTAQYKSFYLFTFFHSRHHLIRRKQRTDSRTTSKRIKIRTADNRNG